MSEQIELVELRRSIAELVQTEDEVHTVLRMLEETDWGPLIAEAQSSRLSQRALEAQWQEEEEERRKIREAYDQRLAPCGLCRKPVPYNQLAYPRPKSRTYQREIPRHDFRLYCPECRKTVIEKYKRICKICNNKFIANNHQNTCPQCWWKDEKNLSAQVKTARVRARENKRDATLTVKQWRSTVEHFEGKCAYCQRMPMEALDHFIPITKGGGTTEDNCVPICNSCNNHKTGYNPNNHEILSIRYMLLKDIHRVRTYLSNKK